MKVSLSLIVVCVLLGLCRCSCTTDISGGGGSETTNSITVCIKENQISGVAASDAHVELYYETFNPIMEKLPDSLKVITDANGRYMYSRIANGRYNVYSYYDSADNSKRTAFINSLIIPSDTIIHKDYQLPSAVKVNIQKVGRVAFPVSIDSNINFYLKGTPFFIDKDLRSADSFTLEGVPSGAYNSDINFYDNNRLGFEWVTPDTVSIKSENYGVSDSGKITIQIIGDTTGKK
jgi:hypothetical protein